MAATVRVVTKHSPLALFLYMTKITLTAGGESRRVRWGEEALSLEPGQHEIGVSFRYLGTDAGKAAVIIDVADNTTSTITYKAPFFMFSAGRIKVENSH